MMDREAVRRRAEQDLLLHGEGSSDRFLCDRALRVARTAECVAALEEVSAQRINADVLLVGALYAEAGWAVQYREGRVLREGVLSKPTSPWQREAGAALMERSLGDQLGRGVVSGASSCIRSLSDHDLPMVEAQIVREASALAEFGLLAIWQAARRNALDGKGLGDAIDTWTTLKEYGYWSVRIKDTFRFDSTRRIATERLKRFEACLEELAEQADGEDIVDPEPSSVQA